MLAPVVSLLEIEGIAFDDRERTYALAALIVTGALRFPWVGTAPGSKTRRPVIAPPAAA